MKVTERQHYYLGFYRPGRDPATPLQIANLAATIANRGHFITPHVVKEIQDTVMPAQYLEKHTPTIAAHWYNDIAEGMRIRHRRYMPHSQPF